MGLTGTMGPGSPAGGPTLSVHLLVRVLVQGHRGLGEVRGGHPRHFPVNVGCQQPTFDLLPRTLLEGPGGPLLAYAGQRGPRHGLPAALLLRAPLQQTPGVLVPLTLSPEQLRVAVSKLCLPP